MEIVNIQNYRRIYKQERNSGDGYNEDFIGNYFKDDNNQTVNGWFSIYHGDKDGNGNARKGVANFLQTFLDMAKDGQAVYEFLQNAVDAQSTHYAMVWGKDEDDDNYYLLVANNGKMFRTENIRSILNVGSSTKSADSKTIGKFGIGFKLAHRLVGKDNGLEELIDNNNGPILFSWKNYEIADLAKSTEATPQQNLPENLDFANFSDMVTAPWLFKILITCFPCAPANSIQDDLPILFDGIKSTTNPFSKAEYSTFSKWVRRNMHLFDEETYKEGSIFFLKLGSGKEADLSEINLREGIKFSLAILKESEPDEKKRGEKLLHTVQINDEEKITYPDLEYVHLNVDKYSEKDNYSYVRFGVDSYDELSPEQIAKYDDEENIEILFGFRKFDQIDDFFKGAPNFYLYFPLSEEVHNFNFILHSNAFYKSASRTFLHQGNAIEDGINIRLFKIIVRKIDELLAFLSSSSEKSDREKFLNFYAALLTSKKNFHNQREWVDKPFIQEIDKILSKYIPVKVSHSSDDYVITSNSKEVYLNSTLIKTDFKDWGINGKLFYWSGDLHPDIIEAARSKLNINDFSFYQLLNSNNKVSDHINNWIGTDHERIELILNEIRNLDGQKINVPIFRQNLFNLKIVPFNNGEILSLNEFREREDEGFLIIQSNLHEIRSVLEKSNLKTSLFDYAFYGFGEIFNLFNNRNSQVKSHVALVQFFSEHIEDEFLLSLKSEEKFSIYKTFRHLNDENQRGRLRELKLLSDKSGKPRKFKNLLAETNLDFLQKFTVKKDEHYSDYKFALTQKESEIYADIIYPQWDEIFTSAATNNLIDNDFFDKLRHLYVNSAINADDELLLSEWNLILYKNQIVEEVSPLINQTFVNEEESDFIHWQNQIHNHYSKYLPDQIFLKHCFELPFQYDENELPTRFSLAGLEVDGINGLISLSQKFAQDFFSNNTIIRKGDLFEVHSANRAQQFYSENETVLNFVDKYCSSHFVLLPLEFAHLKNDVRFTEDKLISSLIDRGKEFNIKFIDLLRIIKLGSHVTKRKFFTSIPQVKIFLDGQNKEFTDIYLSLLDDIAESTQNVEDFEVFRDNIILVYGKSETKLSTIDSTAENVLITNPLGNEITISKSKILYHDNDDWISRISTFHKQKISENVISERSSQLLFKISGNTDNKALKEKFIELNENKEIVNSEQLIFLLFSKEFSKDEVHEFRVKCQYEKFYPISGNLILFSELNKKFGHPVNVMSSDYEDFFELLAMEGSLFVNFSDELADIILASIYFVNGFSTSSLAYFGNDYFFDDIISIPPFNERIDFLYTNWKKISVSQRISIGDKSQFDRIQEYFTGICPGREVSGAFSFPDEKLPSELMQWLSDDDDKFSFLVHLGLNTEGSKIDILRNYLVNGLGNPPEKSFIDEIDVKLLTKTLKGLAQIRKEYQFKLVPETISTLEQIIHNVSTFDNKPFPALVYSSPSSIYFEDDLSCLTNIVWQSKNENLITLIDDLQLLSELKIPYKNLYEGNFIHFDTRIATEEFSQQNKFVEDDNIFYRDWSTENKIRIFYAPEIRIDMRISQKGIDRTIGFYNAEFYYISSNEEQTSIYLLNGLTVEFLVNHVDFSKDYADLCPFLEEYIQNKNTFVKNVINKLSSLNTIEIEDEDLLLAKQVISDEAEKDEREVLIERLLEIESTEGKYSYDWFKVYLLILETFNENKSIQQYKSIRFSKISEVKDDKFYRLSGCSTYISNDITEIIGCNVTIYFNNGTKKPLPVANLSKENQDLIIQSDIKLDKQLLNSVFQIELEYQPIIDLLSRLRIAFEKLDEWSDIKESFPPLEYIYGPPGTGKTHTICEKIMDSVSQNNNVRYLVLTPTNKASDVIGERLLENHFYKFLRLSSPTSFKIDEEYYTNDLHLDQLKSNNVLISTIHRFPYYALNLDQGSMYLNGLRDFWDYIVIDECSMVSLPYLVFSIMRVYSLNPNVKVLIAGDPKQIPPVPEVNDKLLEEINVGYENIYSMLGLSSFIEEEQILEVRSIDKVKNLPLQRRSVPEIGNLFSNLSYGGKVANHKDSSDIRPINKAFQKIFKDPVTFLNIPVNQNNEVYSVFKLFHSSYHLYSCILLTKIIEYLHEQNTDDEEWTVGIISPYKYQATLINRLIANLDISDKFKITADTVHGFQGDQCNIVFFVVNPNNYRYTGDPRSLLSKEYIYNVAISRAQDYLIIVSPFHDIPDNKYIGDLSRINKEENKQALNILESHSIEKLLFGSSNYIASNSFITSHDNVNVFSPSSYKYYVKRGSTAIDIQLS